MASPSNRQTLKGQNGDNSNVVHVNANINNLSSRISSVAAMQQSVLSSPSDSVWIELEKPTYEMESEIMDFENQLREHKEHLADFVKVLRELCFGQNCRYGPDMIVIDEVFKECYQRLNKIVIPDDFKDDVLETAVRERHSFYRDKSR